jgi:hypothetical protein
MPGVRKDLKLGRNSASSCLQAFPALKGLNSLGEIAGPHITGIIKAQWSADRSRERHGRLMLLLRSRDRRESLSFALIPSCVASEMALRRQLATRAANVKKDALPLSDFGSKRFVIYVFRDG